MSGCSYNGGLRLPTKCPDSSEPISPYCPGIRCRRMFYRYRLPAGYRLDAESLTITHSPLDSRIGYGFLDLLRKDQSHRHNRDDGHHRQAEHQVMLGIHAG